MVSLLILIMVYGYRGKVDYRHEEECKYKELLQAQSNKEAQNNRRKNIPV